MDYDLDGPCANVIGCIDTVHGRIQDFSNPRNNVEYYSTHYGVPCQKWSVICDRQGKQLLYCSKWGITGRLLNEKK